MTPTDKDFLLSQNKRWEIDIEESQASIIHLLRMREKIDDQIEAVYSNIETKQFGIELTNKAIDYLVKQEKGKKCTKK